MRFSHLTVFALSGLSIASPVVTKRADVQSLLNDLFATVQTYTGAINATLATLSPSSNLLEKTAAIPKIGQQITLITAAISSTTTEIKALAPPGAKQPTQKRAITSTSTELVESEPQEKRQLQQVAVGAILALIIVEIFATVAGAIAIVGLAGLLIFLNPLTGAISALILAVELVLNVVLGAVVVLLDTLLTGLALGVSGL